MEFSYLVEQHPWTKFLVPGLTLFSLNHDRTSRGGGSGTHSSAAWGKAEFAVHLPRVSASFCDSSAILEPFSTQGAKQMVKPPVLTSVPRWEVMMGQNSHPTWPGNLTDITPSLPMPLTAQLW